MKRFYIQKDRHFSKSNTTIFQEILKLVFMYKKRDTLRCVTFLYTVMLIEITHFSVGKLLLHHYGSNLAHISDRCISVNKLYFSDI